MIRATRREALIGAMVVPAAAALPQVKLRGRAVLLHDPELAVPTAFAGNAAVLAITGDPIRFARAVFARRPAMVLGLSRHADALLIEDVAREAGYRPAAAPGGLGRRGWALVPKS